MIPIPVNRSMHPGNVSDCALFFIYVQETFMFVMSSIHMKPQGGWWDQWNCLYIRNMVSYSKVAGGTSTSVWSKIYYFIPKPPFSPLFERGMFHCLGLGFLCKNFILFFFIWGQDISWGVCLAGWVMCFKGVRAGHRECVAQGVGGRQRKDNSTCISGKEYEKKESCLCLFF